MQTVLIPKLVVPALGAKPKLEGMNSCPQKSIPGIGYIEEIGRIGRNHRS